MWKLVTLCYFQISTLCKYLRKWARVIDWLFILLKSKIETLYVSINNKKENWVIEYPVGVGSGVIYQKEDSFVCGRERLSFSSVAQSCPTLCDPMNRSTPGLPVDHQLPEFTQTHVHQVSDAIQPSHPLSSPSPPAPNPSQHQSLFQWVNSSHEVAKLSLHSNNSENWKDKFFSTMNNMNYFL